jgi:hypothetical protein
MNKFNVITKTIQKFHSFFPGIRFNDFMDPALSFCIGKPKIDLIKFDNYLHEKHGNYEFRDMSMSDVLAQNYGDKARAFIEGLI